MPSLKGGVPGAFYFALAESEPHQTGVYHGMRLDLEFSHDFLRDVPSGLQKMFKIDFGPEIYSCPVVLTPKTPRTLF